MYKLYLFIIGLVICAVITVCTLILESKRTEAVKTVKISLKKKKKKLL